MEKNTFESARNPIQNDTVILDTLTRRLCKTIQNSEKGSEEYVSSVERLISLHKNLIYERAKHIIHGESSKDFKEDIYATGYLALIEAATRYRYDDYSVSFSTFATVTIIGLFNKCINSTRMVPMKSPHYGQYQAASKGEKTYKGESIHPNIIQLAQEGCVSLESIVEEDGNEFEIPDNPYVEEETVNKSLYSGAFSTLSGRDKEILYKIYVKNIPQKQIADEYHLTAARISQLKTKALSILRAKYKYNQRY